MDEIKPEKTGVVNNNTLIVGVDIGKVMNTGYCRCPDGTEVKAFEFFNNGRGFNKFWGCINHLSNKHNVRDIVVGIESTGSYGEPFIHYMKRREVRLVQVNPMHTKRVKELCDNSPNKTDKKDPKVIADIIGLGHSLKVVVPEGVSAQLRRLTHARERHLKMRTNFFNQLESLMAVIFPEFLSVMKKIKTKSAYYLLKGYPTPIDIVGIGIDKLVDILKKSSRGRLGKECGNLLYNAAKESVGIKEGRESIVLEMNSLFKMIEICNCSIEEIEIKMRGYLQQIPYSKYILSIKGIGEITVAGLIGEVGDFRHFKTIGEIIKLAGLNLFEISSGRHKGERHISKRGRALMRKIMFFASINVIRKGGIMYEQYQGYLRNGMTKMKAVIAIARKLLGIISALVREHSYYIMDYRKENSSLVETVI